MPDDPEDDLVEVEDDEFEEEDIELDDAELDEEGLDDDDLVDDDELVDDELVAEDEEEDDGEVVVKRAVKAGEEDVDEDDLEELDPDDVEADLDTILKDRIAAADDEEEDEEDEVVDVDDRGDTNKIQPRRPGEFVCQSCFLLKPSSQLADSKRRYETEWTELTTAWQQGLAQFHATAEDINRESNALFPPWDARSWNDWQPPTTVPPVIRFGGYQLDLAKLPGGLPTEERTPSSSRTKAAMRPGTPW